MRVMVLVLMSLCCGLFAGCDTSLEATNEPSMETEARELVSAMASPPGGPCAQDCDCQIGSRCGAEGLCIVPPISGPRPPNPRCFADCQCGAGQYCDLNATQCKPRPTCSVSWSAATVPRGGWVDFIITSQNVPANGYSRLYGTRNGGPDENGQIFHLVSGTYPIPNDWGGVYMRYMKMYSSTHQFLCQTNQATVTFEY